MSNSKRLLASVGGNYLVPVLGTIVPAALLLGVPAAGYLIGGLTGLVIGLAVSVALTSKPAWSLILKPVAGSRLESAIVGACNVCVIGASDGSSRAGGVSALDDQAIRDIGSGGRGLR